MVKKKVDEGKPVPEIKKKIVNDFVKMISNHRTMLIASCKGLPGKQFHEIKKKLRGKAEIMFAKKNMILRAIDNIEKGALKNLKKELTSDFAILFSELEPFELSALLADNQSSAKAKGGDIAPEDIEIEPGPTDLPAGPAISELGSVGLKVKVTDGKLEIIQGSIVARKGDKIKPNAASVLGKLNVQPMRVGFLPLAVYDSKEEKIYTNIVIDKKGTLEELRNLIGKAISFAVKVKYPCDKTISYFIAKASAEYMALNNLLTKNKTENSDSPKQETKEEA